MKEINNYTERTFEISKEEFLQRLGIEAEHIINIVQTTNHSHWIITVRKFP